MAYHVNSDTDSYSLDERRKVFWFECVRPGSDDPGLSLFDELLRDHAGDSYMHKILQALAKLCEKFL